MIRIIATGIVKTDVYKRQEKPTQPGDVNFMEMMKILMEDNRKKMEEKMEKTNESIASSVSYTHLDVYKRQLLDRRKISFAFHSPSDIR